MIKTAQKAAKEAGKILLEHYGKVSSDAIRKKMANDFISFVDEQSEQKIMSILKNQFPGHGFLAEESGIKDHKADFQWIIDPLDGTTNYLKGIPVYCISIALRHKTDLVLGVIYDPLRNEMFYAEKGKGAFLNEEKISVTTTNILTESFIATGFPFKIKHFLDKYQMVFKDVFSETIGMRRMGSAAIDLAYVAAGRFDGFWEIGLSPWDVAAGAVIIHEAGGTVTDFWNNNKFLFNNYLLASNGRIHQKVLKILQRQFPFYTDVYSNEGE